VPTATSTNNNTVTLYISYSSSNTNFARFGGAIHAGYFKGEDSVLPEDTFRFATVTDMDQLSKMADKKKPTFRSLLLPGSIRRDNISNQYTIHFEPIRTLTSEHNEAGRGMELSELTIFQNRLLSFDDRTGTVFEILNKQQGKDSYVVPRFVMTEGSGDTDKGMKWEWATVKNNELYMGSMGKEYTNKDGSIENTNNLWVAVLTGRGEVRRMDWSKNYNVVRAALDASAPGYIIHEAVLWSAAMKKWVFLPRRISSDAYDERLDEKKGSNKLVLVDEAFTSPKVVEIAIKDIDPLHGFSTFAFVPGTGDRHALAVRTVEEDCVGGDADVCKQRSYFIIFDVTTGEVLMDQVRYDEHDVKFEGIEFVNIYTPEPTKQ
jgi:soluble calcium-activated nucleotidase 1